MITSAAGGSVGQHSRHVALGAGAGTGALGEGGPCAGEADSGAAAVGVAHASAILQQPRCDGHCERASWRGLTRPCQYHTQTLSPHTARLSVVFSWCRAGAASLVDHVVLHSREGSWMVRV